MLFVRRSRTLDPSYADPTDARSLILKRQHKRQLVTGARGDPGTRSLGRAERLRHHHRGGRGASSDDSWGDDSDEDDHDDHETYVSHILVTVVQTQKPEVCHQGWVANFQGVSYSTDFRPHGFLFEKRACTHTRSDAQGETFLFTDARAHTK